MRNGNDSERLVDRRGMPRCTLLRAGGGLAALSVLRIPWALGGGREAAWRPKVALSSVMFSQLSLDAFCRRAAELGFKGIDLWGRDPRLRQAVDVRLCVSAGEGASATARPRSRPLYTVAKMLHRPFREECKVW